MDFQTEFAAAMDDLRAGRHALALERLRELRARADVANGDPHEALLACRGVASAAQRLRLTDARLEALRRALKLSAFSSTLAEIHGAELRVELAEALREGGDLERAEELVCNALATLRARTGAAGPRARALVLRAVILEETGRRASALASAREALALAASRRPSSPPNA